MLKADGNTARRHHPSRSAVTGGRPSSDSGRCEHCQPSKKRGDAHFSTLEHERISRCRYTTRDQARLDIATWIDTWYNKKRLHSTNNMTSPTDYEHAHQT